MASIPVTIVGYLSYTDLSIGGGPIIGGGNPPGIWGPPGPWPTPPIANVPPIVNPNPPGWGLHPTHPIMLPGMPGWGDPHPVHPIVIPPVSIMPPIYYPPTSGGGGGGTPSFPIWGPPGSNFPDKPGYPPVATPPIYYPPPGGDKPPVSGGIPMPPAANVPIEGSLVWIPGYGWTFVPASAGSSKPPDSGSGDAPHPEHPIVLPEGTSY